MSGRTVRLSVVRVRVTSKTVVRWSVFRGKEVSWKVVSEIVGQGEDNYILSSQIEGSHNEGEQIEGSHNEAEKRDCGMRL